MPAINAFVIALILSVAGYGYVKLASLTARIEALVDKGGAVDLRGKESRKVILQLENGQHLLGRDVRLLQDSVKRLVENHSDMATPAAALPDKDADGKSILDQIFMLRASQELQSRFTLSLNEDVKRCKQDYKEFLAMKDLIQQQEILHRRNLENQITRLERRVRDSERQQANK